MSTAITQNEDDISDLEDNTITADSGLQVSAGGTLADANTNLQIAPDGVDETHIDWGLGPDQVSAEDIPIRDSTSLITADNVEDALVENRILSDSFDSRITQNEDDISDLEDNTITADSGLTVSAGGTLADANTNLRVATDGIKDTHIDWGTGANQVSAGDVPIADSGSIISATDVEGALQENRNAIDAIEDNGITAGDGITTSGTIGADNLNVSVNIEAGAALEFNSGELRIKADGIKDTHIDWGTGANQVSAADVPIADSGSIISATDVEGALQENRGAIDTLETDILNLSGTKQTAFQIDDDNSGPKLTNNSGGLDVLQDDGVTRADVVGADILGDTLGADSTTRVEARFYAGDEDPVSSYRINYDGYIYMLQKYLMLFIMMLQISGQFRMNWIKLNMVNVIH